MKIRSNNCINTRNIVEHLGTNVATKFYQIHAAIGRGTTFFLHAVDKFKVSQ